MRRLPRTVAAWLALAALVFAQLATAAYACPQLAPDEARAAFSDCDRGMDPALPNLCERHCDYGSASVETPKPLAAPFLASSFVQPIAPVFAADAVRAEPRARIATGPPLTRFTVLRI